MGFWVVWGSRTCIVFLTLVSMSISFFLLWDSPISCFHIVSYPPTSSKPWLSCQYSLTLSSCMQAQKFKWKIKLAFQEGFFLVWKSWVQIPDDPPICFDWFKVITKTRDHAVAKVQKNEYLLTKTTMIVNVSTCAG